MPDHFFPRFFPRLKALSPATLGPTGSVAGIVGNCTINGALQKWSEIAEIVNTIFADEFFKPSDEIKEKIVINLVF